MKKIYKIFTIAFAALMISALSGCALLNELFNKARGPVDQWVNYELPFKYKGTTITLDTYIMYSLDGVNYTNLKEGYSFKDEGMSILIIPNVEADKVADKTEEEKATYSQIITEVFGDEFNTSYIFKQWKLGDEIMYNKNNEGETTASVKMDRTKWDILYMATKWGAGFEADDEDAGLPYVLGAKVKAFKEYEASSDIWKKILGAIILNKLM